MLDPGTILEGRYAVMNVIGKGGMGTVYLGHLLSLQSKRVAIKEVTVSFHSDEDREQAMKRFKREAALLASLDHANLVHINDFFTQGDSAFLVCDYVEGTNLQQLIDKTDGFLPLVVVLRLFGQLCDVLEYCHGRPSPVVFRDLKPDNVMITGDGQVKLIDFGIACIVEPGRTTSSFLQGTGTHGFAPIEQYTPNPHMDPTSDIYSLGATLYSMVTGKVPPSAVELATGETELAAPDSINPDVTPAYSDFIANMMKTQKTDRYQTVAEVRQALETVSNPPRLLKNTKSALPPPEAKTKTAKKPGAKSAAAAALAAPRSAPAKAAPPTSAPGPLGGGGGREPVVTAKADPGADEIIGAWRKKRECPKCGAEERRGAEVCLNCGHALRRRTISLFEPMHAQPTAPLVITPEELERAKELNRPPLDFRQVPQELRPQLPHVKGSVRLPQGLIDYLTARDNREEEVQILELDPQHVSFRAAHDHPPGTLLNLQLGIPVLKVGDRILLDAKVQVTEVGPPKNNRKLYSAEFKGLAQQAVRLLDSLARQERRAARRFPRTCQIVSKDLPNYKALTTDIAATGLGFLSNRAMPIGGLIELRLDPDLEAVPHLTVLARIIHCREAQDGRFKVGATFMAVSDKSTRTLHDFLRSMLGS